MAYPCHIAEKQSAAKCGVEELRYGVAWGEYCDS